MSLSMAVSVTECRDTRTPITGHGSGDTESGLAEAELLEFNLHLQVGLLVDGAEKADTGQEDGP